MGFVGAAATLAVGVGTTVYEGHQANKAAAEAREAARPRTGPIHPTGSVLDTGEQLKAGSLLAQTAGGSLLSDPVENARTGKQTGTLPGSGHSLLGS